jgi:hypothetical protein
VAKSGRVDAQVSKRIVGVVGELLLLRRVMERGLLEGRAGWSGNIFHLLLGTGATTAKAPENTEERWANAVYLTTDTRLLNLVADHNLHAEWQAMQTGEDRGPGRYAALLEEMVQGDRRLREAVGELTRHPRCVLHARYAPVLHTLHHVLPPHEASAAEWWNAAVMYTDMFDQGTRDPALVRRLLGPTDRLPDGLGLLITQLLENADKYLEFLWQKAEEPRQFRHGMDVGRFYVEKDEEELTVSGLEGPGGLPPWVIITHMYSETVYVYKAALTRCV